MVKWINFWCFELFLCYIWMMSRKSNLIQIQTTNTSIIRHSSVRNSYTLNQLWQIKASVELDRSLSIISPGTVNLIRRLRLQRRRYRGNRGGVKVHHTLLERNRSVNINNIIQCKPNYLDSRDIELRKNLELTVVNIRSIKNKDSILLDHLVESKTDICMVTETWLNEDDNTWLECCDLSKNGYQIHSANRKNRRGGGLAIITTTNMKIKLLEKGDKSSFEYAAWKVSMNNSFMTLLAVYHPPITN